MTDAAAAPVTCPGCGQKYPWKPQYAGRKLRCKCGQMIVMSPGNRPPENSSGAAPVAATTPTARHAGKPEAGSREKSQIEEAESLARRHRITELYIPIILMVVGVVIQIAQQMYYGSDSAEPVTILTATIAVAAQIVLLLPMMLVGVLIAVKVLDVSFGPLTTALFKLIAVLLAPAAFGAIVTILAGGGILADFWGFLIQVAAYYGLLMWMFDLEFFEAMATSVIFYFIQFAAGIVAAIVLARIM